MCKVKDLENILQKRLPDIKRWRRVDVVRYDDPLLKDIQKRFFYQGWPESMAPEKGVYYVVWHDCKGGNIHDFDIRRRPVSFLAESIKQNRLRLKNRSKTTA